VSGAPLCSHKCKEQDGVESGITDGFNRLPEGRSRRSDIIDEYDLSSAGSGGEGVLALFPFLYRRASLCGMVGATLKE
jgi:hypothetical protein